MKIPKIYCINLKSCVGRRKKMINRLQNLDLLDQTTFIDAVSRDSPLIDYYHQSSKQVDPDTRVWKSSMACFASHLKAIRTFLEDGSDECLICEDDIMFKNNFMEEYQKIRSNMLPDSPYVSLSYMVRDWNGISWSGVNVEKYNIAKHEKDSIWGLQLYWISKDYAIRVLTEFDKPYVNDEYNHESETIILHHSIGYLAYPVLAIEEGNESERDPENLDFHRQSFDSWGRENYTDAEKPYKKL